MPKLATAIPHGTDRIYWFQLAVASVAIGALTWIILRQIGFSIAVAGSDATLLNVPLLMGAAASVLLFFHGSRACVLRQQGQALRTAHALINKMAATIVIINERGLIEGVSDNFPDIFGYSRCDITGKKLSLLMPELENGAYSAFIARGLSAAETSDQRREIPVVEVRAKSGVSATFEFTISEIHVGRRRMFTVCLRDASSHRAARERILTLEEDVHLRDQVLQTSLSGIGLVSVLPEGPRITQVNPAFERITGYPAAMVVGTDPQVLFDAGDLASSVQAELSVLSKTPFHREFSLVRRDGASIDIDLNLVPIRKPTGEATHFVAMFNDITEKKRSAEEHSQADRLRSLGQLTSNVAHDFNNFLAIIKGNLEMLQAALPTGSHERTLSDRAMRGCGLAADLIQLLAAFARRQHLRPALSNVVEIMEQLRTMIPGFLDHDIGIALRCEQPKAMIMVDQSQLQSCILNLAINSRDAMPEGGEVVLEVARARTLPHGAISASPEPAPSYIRISVIDTGTGMPEHVRQRALEPFFTTKPVGKGTGLGLSTVFGFAQQSGGAMLIESTEHVGTTVSLFFPEVPAA